MSFETRCPQCVFLTRHCGRLTPCLLHLGTPVAVKEDYDEPYEFGRVRPTADCPAPFTLREYSRLLLLRSRVRAVREAALAK